MVQEVGNVRICMKGKVRVKVNILNIIESM